jgi:protein-disulfide isomerase
MHRFAKLSGVAAECAAEQARFTEMQEVLFAKQDSLGLKPWSEYATDAKVGDLSRFTECMADSVSLAPVTNGLTLAEKLKLSGTPTIFINDHQLVGEPTHDASFHVGPQQPSIA